MFHSETTIANDSLQAFLGRQGEEKNRCPCKITGIGLRPMTVVAIFLAKTGLSSPWSLYGSQFLALS